MKETGSRSADAAYPAAIRKKTGAGREARRRRI